MNRVGIGATIVVLIGLLLVIWLALWNIDAQLHDAQAQLDHNDSHVQAPEPTPPSTGAAG